MVLRRRVALALCLSVSAFALVSAFQNCSQVGFAKNSATTSKSGGGSGDPTNPTDPTDPTLPGGGPGDPNNFGTIDGGDPVTTNGKTTQEGWVDNTPMYDRSDVLFVVDESISMGGITDKVRSGFESIAAAQFPADTLMAVTNTHPAYVNADGSFNHSKAYRSKLVGLSDQPGFQKLVTKSTIGSYLSMHPGDGSKFPAIGCDKEWFRPTDSDAKGASCLKGATQSALKGTGEEAGVTALLQLTSRMTASGKALFRDKALVNVIFVSDTHDAGTAYYGKAGAMPQIPTLAQLKSKILSNSPNVLGVKFHGIVPLPVQGDPLVQGLDYLGTLPADSNVTGESMWGFSYLPFIKGTGGKALHPTEPGWGAAIQKIVESTGRPTDLVIVLDKAAKSISSLYINGQLVNPATYALRADKKTIVVTNAGSWDLKVHVRVEYEAI